MALAPDLRPIEPGELDAFLGCIVTAMGSTLTPEGRRQHEATLEYDRTLAAFDGPDLVATAQALTFAMSVPGGADVPTAGVKGVTTLPTHRRRGLLRALMRRQLDDLHERGDVLACLWPTEGAIYPRFGYGLATLGMSISVERPAPAFVDDTGGAMPARLVPRDEHVATAAPLHERLRPSRPGMHRRTEAAWRRWADMAPNATLVATDGGYARYTVTSDWGRRGPANRVSIHELVATTPVAECTLWRYLFELDLAAEWSAFHRPLDDPLQWLVTDARTLSRDVHGGLFVRLVDLPRALAARAYRSPLDVVVEVSDPFCQWNEGRWRIEAGEDGARCERTSAAADIAANTGDLAAAYLGGVGLDDLARAGRVVELREGAVARAAVALRWSPLPWAVTWF